jgi:hypothetical protein
LQRARITYEAWEQNNIEKTRLIKNCVLNILELSKLSICIFGDIIAMIKQTIKSKIIVPIAKQYLASATFSQRGEMSNKNKLMRF